MNDYRIEFYNMKDKHFLIDYYKMFRNEEEAIEWALLYSQTSNDLKNYDMKIYIHLISKTKTIYYYVEQ